MIELSITIVNWNTEELVLDCLNSILSSNPKVEYEIIVVDNGSSDGSVAAVKKLKKAATKLKIIENNKNLGFAKANNQGIRIARGKYVLLLNSDTKVKEGAIDKIYSFAKSHADAGVVGGRLLNPDGSLQASCFHFPSIKNAVLTYWLGKKGLLEKYAPSGKGPVPVDVVVGAFFLITPAAKIAVGPLDERYFFFFEDFDYCRRVWADGLKVYYLPSSEVVHLHGATVKELSSEEDAWRKLIPGSKLYHGLFRHYIINFIIWSGQKWRTLLREN